MSSAIDWTHWRRMERLPLGDAICLLLRIDPRSGLGKSVSRMSSSSDFSTQQRDLYKRAHDIWEVAWASYHERSLGMNAGAGGASVSMRDWLEWAHRKGYGIPSELHDLVPAQDTAAEAGDDPDEAGRPLATKTRNTLLVIIAALADELDIDIDQPTKASEVIAVLTQKFGANLTSRGIENHLRAIPDALESRRK